MDKITIDFENLTVHIQNDSQDGIHTVFDLAERKSSILEALGYAQVDLGNAISAMNNYFNGAIDKETLIEIFEHEADECKQTNK